jgi:hypothetical protein
MRGKEKKNSENRMGNGKEKKRRKNEVRLSGKSGMAKIMESRVRKVKKRR